VTQDGGGSTEDSWMATSGLWPAKATRHKLSQTLRTNVHKSQRQEDDVLSCRAHKTCSTTITTSRTL